MPKAWTPPFLWIFGVATALGLFSTLQAYRLTMLHMRMPADVEVSRLLALNLAYWYVPAALTPSIFRLAHRFRADSIRWIRTTGIHVCFAALFSVAHFTCMLCVRAMVLPSGGKAPTTTWPEYAQRVYLTNLDWALMTYAAIVGLSYALGYYRESQARALRAARLETRLVEARLRALEAELHPHFLFNTLHAISALVHSNPESADRMISRLSELIRLTLDRSDGSLVPLVEEVEFLRKYLEIEQTRFHDRLTVRFDVDPETLDADVPRLILQPLVEHAISHGVSDRAGPAVVQIAATRRSDVLSVAITSNGAPRADTRAHDEISVAFSNTRARLECLYGSAHRLELSGESGAEGLTIRLEIPFHSTPAVGDESAAWASPRAARLHPYPTRAGQV